ncbi:MAG: sulfurtransferase [Hyphomicrobium zavarzinii]|jgi:thiosulfate/3-mercaptopyruvate sulfurtransferase|uniref:sulfurtransferase n=1 Tax=Hyphomicrobium zavarzinii TaxID=48292 RepID=UPI001A4A2097|nr:sulfurtransferase [Hyphomicrobium zavarzinii]MBL8845549.1 sulfurtransferase [Hyphomicrobium zavarzinii]
MTLRHLITAVAALAATTLSVTAFAAPAKEPLVTYEWVQKNLDNPKVRIIEVSVDPGVYERGHVPGALNFRWHTDLVDKVSRDIVSRENFEKLIQGAGIDKDTTVVLYGDNNNWFAAWGAWVFHVHGLGEQVRLLDGGRKIWELKQLPLDTKTAEVKATDYKLPDGKPNLRARLSDVLAAAEKKTDVHVIDIRSADEYQGKIFAPEGSKELSVRAGHVPGAVNVTWSKAVNAEDGTFKPAADLKKLYADAGVDGSKPIITYCRIGERSSHTWYLLTQILGYDVKNYDGSWTEYGNSVGTPVTNLAGTVWLGK